MKNYKGNILGYISKCTIIGLVLLHQQANAVLCHHYADGRYFFNPCVLDRLLKKSGIDITVYLKSLMFAMYFLGVLFALLIVFIISKLIIKEGINIALQDFESALKITVYIIYMAILFANRNADKITKYIIFGLIYFICVLISFASQTFNETIASFISAVTRSNLNLEAYKLFMYDILIPIREAILTYIIFDTIIVNKDTEKVTKQILTTENTVPNESIMHNEKNNAIIENKIYDVKVSDNRGMENLNYKIYIHKH